MMKEATSQITFPPELLSLLEKNDFTILSTDEQNGEFVSELETYSPAGEDVIITIWHDGTTEDFIHSFYQYAIDFDPDEHAEMWIESRGKNGVPSSIRDLIADADDIDDALNDMAEKLYDWHREWMEKIGQAMIQFKTFNSDGNLCLWKYASVEELKKEWLSDDINMDVPANDDTVFDVEINGEKMVFPDGTFFEDILTYFGIEIWL